MKNIIAALMLGSAAGIAGAMPAPAEKAEIITPDSTGFYFTDVISLPTTPVKNQNKSGTCWCFAGTSLLEEDVLRRGGPELDLSEMYWVRQNYIDKAKKYMRMDGTINFAQGGGFADVFEACADYGAVPEEVYAGLNYGEEKHSHYEMADALKGYLDAIRSGGRNLTTAWLRGFTAALDAYLGEVPEEFVYNGKKYTPQTFAKEFNLTPEDYVSVTSFTHHPFNEWIALEIPDNWRWTKSYNVPLDEMKRMTDEALANGYTVGWAADVSEPGWQWRKGYAILPEEKGPEDLTDNEAAKWDQMTEKERKELTYDNIKGPVKEKTVTQEMRQKHFDNKETTDDHGMVIVGTAVDQEGNKYYKVKNSWDTNQLYEGYIYVSEPYFLDKTIGVTFNRKGVKAMNK